MPKEVWSFIEIEKGRLHDTAPKMASEARRISQIFGAKPCGVLFSSPYILIEDLEPYGLERIYSFQAKDSQSPETIVNALFSLTLQLSPEFFLFASTPLGSELGARLAAKLKKGLISNYVDIELEEGVPIARKPVHGGKAHLIARWVTPPPYLATVNLDALEAVEAEQRVKPEIVTEKLEALEGKSTFIRRWKVDLSELDISEANVVIGVGKGVDKEESMEAIEKLAESLEGVIGGTRIAVFNGLIPAERLIGTSGKWISPEVYIAIGVSGAPQHVMGIKGAKHIIAINVSRNAPIFKYSELGVVGDLHEVVPKTLDLMGKETG